MANQPKKYKKFVATAATATLVASAIVPVASAAEFTDVGNLHPATKAELDRAVELGLMTGIGSKFQPNSSITRGQVAKALAKYIAGQEDLTIKEYFLKYDLADTVEPFSDVPANSKDAELYQASLIVKDAEVFSGANNKLSPTANIQRQHMAKVVVNAFGLEGNDKEVEIKDLDKALSEHRENIIILAQNGVTMPVAGYFSPSDSVTRIQMASFLVRAYETAEAVEVTSVEVENTTTLSVKVKEANKNLKVANFDVVVDGKGVVPTAVKADEKGEVYTLTIPALEGKGEVVVNDVKASYDFVNVTVTSVKATNATTLAVTGRNLNHLKVEDIKVESNVVASVVASADGKSAVVTLGGSLPASKDVKVTVVTGETSKDYTVNFSLAASKVAVKDAVYDDDTKGQKLNVVVDGIETTVDYLISSGYSVVFNAYDSKGALANTELFDTAGNAASTSGQLKSTGPIKVDEYTATVVIAKGSTILTSEPAKISVRNIDNAATAISKFDFFLDKGTDLVDATDVELNSKTLVIGEKAYVGTLTLGVGTAAAEISGNGSSSIVEFKSSNPAVVSVGTTNKNQLVAEGIGKSTITMTVGKVTKTFEVTVSGTARKSTTIQATNTKHIVNSPITKGISVLDQYGDPVDGATGLEFVTPTSVTGFNGTPTSISAIAGFAQLSLGTPTDPNQSGTVIVRNAITKDIVGSFVVTTTSINNVASTKLVLSSASESTDNTLNADLASDDTAQFILRDYTPENVPVKSYGANDYTNYTVKFNGNVISVNGDTTGNYTMSATDAALNLAIVGAGTTTLAIYDDNNVLVNTQTITVQKAATKIASVAWKTVPVINYTTNVDYTTVLDVQPAVTGKDPVVKGITLTSPVANAIRVAVNAGTLTAGDIYIDRNDNGISDAGDTLIGKIKYSSTAISTGAIQGLNNVPGTTAQPLSVGTPAKGFLNFQITDEVSADKPVVSTKSVEVDVK